MRPLLTGLLCLILCVPLIAKAEAELFGYYEFQTTGAAVNKEFVHLFSNKLRLDLKANISEKITLAANFNILTYHGKTEWDILSLLPEKVIAQAEPGTEPFYVFPFSDRYYLDNAYLKISLKPFDLILGKQQISLGTGYAWNPTDMFNIKDFLDPTYEQPGHNAIRIDVPLGQRLTLSGIYLPEEDLKNSAWLLMLKTSIWHFDISLLGAQKNWLFHDYTVFDSTSYTFLEIPSQRQMFGLTFSGEIFQVGVWGEFAYNWMEGSKDFFELVIGGDHTFDFLTYLMVEYYHNSLAKHSADQYDLNDWMRMMTQEQKSIARDQIYILMQHPVGDFLKVGLGGIYSPSDNSLALVPSLEATISENIEVTAYLNLLTGKEGTSMSSKLGNGGMFRIRVYF